MPGQVKETRLCDNEATVRLEPAGTHKKTPSWTVKVGNTMAVWAMFKALGQHFTYFWNPGTQQGASQSCASLSSDLKRMQIPSPNLTWKLIEGPE